MIDKTSCCYRIALSLMAFVLVGACHAEPVSFGLFGDTPYSERERSELPKMIAAMAAEPLAFVIHDGDIKSGGSICSDEAFSDILGVFQASRHALIYVPGDNEWTDCHRRSNGRYDPIERLAKLRTMFFVGEQSLGKAPMPLARQSADPAYAAYRENVRWTAGGALFVGMNLPGSSNNYYGTKRVRGPSAEYLDRSRANRTWLAQSFALARDQKLPGIVVVIQANPGFEAAAAGYPNPGYKDFIAQLRAETLAFAGEVVLVHGDTHRFQIDQPLTDPQTSVPLKNFTRVETFGSPSLGWVKGSVDTAAPKLFRFEARPFNPQ